MASDLTTRLGGARSSLAFKAPCRVATTANIALSGFQTIDGEALAEDDDNLRVVVKDQIDPSENGIWDAKATAWTRARDFDGADDVKTGTRVYVTDGTVGAGEYILTTSGEIVIGTTDLAFTRTLLSAMSSPGGDGTLLAGSTLSDPAFTATPTLGVPGTTKGTLSLAGVTSGLVTIQPADVAGTWTLTLPASGGTDGYALTTDGNGVTDWTLVGDVIGPDTATDNAIARYDGTTGKLIQNSGIAISDADYVTGIDRIEMDQAVSYDLAANSFGTVLIFPLDSATQTVGASKTFSAIRFGRKTGGEHTFTIGASSVVSGIYSQPISGSGSDAASNLYGGVFGVTNAGPGTTKGVHLAAFGSGTSTGILILSLIHI